jgi:hypothetical protein
MKPGVAAMKIVTHPHGATLLFDGRPVGRSPIALDKLPAGEHTLVAQLRDHLESSRRFTLAAGEHPTLTLNLVKAGDSKAAPVAPAAAAPVAARPEPPTPAKLEGNGTLAIASNPWCTVAVDGAERGQTPLNLTLSAGNHTLVLTNPDYKVRRQISVNIAPGETLHKKLDFTE